jgi:haloacetate dehalogenase
LTTDYLAGFSRERVTVTDADVFLRCAGSGPVVLLLHGYPQTHLAWRSIAPQLAKKFTVVAADLPGYGDSMLTGLAGSETISKRTMARVLVEVMTSPDMTAVVVSPIA